MRSEILSVGTELLMGQIANTDAQTTVEKLIDAVPDIIDKVKEILPKKKDEDSEVEV